MCKSYYHFDFSYILYIYILNQLLFLDVCFLLFLDLSNFGMILSFYYLLLYFFNAAV